jgi:S1-C subfamily serine protease
MATLAMVAGVSLLAACGNSSTTTSGTPASGTPASGSPVSGTTSAGVGSSEAQLQSDFVTTVKAVSPSVVEVTTPSGLGSGVVLDTKGDIVTNAHVVGTDTKFQVTDGTGRRYSATLVGKFVPDDLAVIRVAGSQLQPLTFADSSQLQVGDMALAVGNPLGFQSSVTQGIVSALGRTITEQNGTALADVIQTSAAINPGNSGGALVDLSGQVIGIPTLAAIDPENSQIASGIGFAIPSNTVKAITSQILKYGHVVNSGRAYLGVQLATQQSGSVVVVSVTAKGPAASAGIAAGDTIISVDGNAVQSADDIATTLANLKPGAKAKVAIRTPAGKTETRTVTLGQAPGV